MNRRRHHACAAPERWRSSAAVALLCMGGGGGGAVARGELVYDCMPAGNPAVLLWRISNGEYADDTFFDTRFGTVLTSATIQMARQSSLTYAAPLTVSI